MSELSREGKEHCKSGFLYRPRWQWPTVTVAGKRQ